MSQTPAQPGRDLAGERRVTIDAAATMTAARPTALIELAESRAGGRPVEDIEHRPFGREVLEEVADARNYLCWWLEQVGRRAARARQQGERDDTPGEIVAAIGQALAATAVAFEHAARAQSLMPEWRRP